MKSVWRYLFLLFLSLFLVSAKSDDNLSKYLEVLEQSKAYRSFSFEDGAPKDGKFMQDKEGYLWGYSSGSKENLSRFNGHKWEQMIKFLLPADQSEIKDVIFSEDNDLFILCKQAMYRWEGMKFTRYKLPKGSEAIEATETSGKLLVICDTGYCVLDGALWKYYLTKKPISKLSAAIAVIISNNLTKKQETKGIFVWPYFYRDAHNTLYSIPITKDFIVNDINTSERQLTPVKNLTSSNIYLYTYTQERTDSLLFIDAKDIQTFGGINSMQELVAQHQQGILFAIRDSDLLYHFDMKSKTIIKHSIKPGYRIVSMYPNFDGNAMNILCGKDNHLVAYAYGQSIGVEDRELTPDYEITVPQPITFYDQILTYCNGQINSSESLEVKLGKAVATNPLILKDTGDSIRFLTPSLYKGSRIHPKAGFLMQFLENPQTSVTNINIYDFQSEHSKTIALPGSILGVKHVNSKAKSAIFATDDKLWFCPFESSFSKLQGNTASFNKVNDDSNCRYGFETNKSFISPRVSLREQSKDGKLRDIKTFEGLGVIGSDEVNELLYLVKVDNLNSILVYHDYKKGSTIEIGRISSKTRLSVDNSQLFCRIGTKYSLYERTKLAKDGRFESFEMVMAKYLKNTKMSIETLIDELDIRLVDSNLAYSKRKIVRFDSSSINSFDIAHKMNTEIRTSKEPKRFVYRELEFLEIPPIIYHLGAKQKLGMKQEFWSNLLDIYTIPGYTYVAYVDSTLQGRNIRISRLENSEILPLENDIVFPITSNKMPNIILKKPKNILYVITDESIYYHSSEAHHRIPIQKSEAMGNLKKAELMGDDLWLLYANGLVKCSLVSGLSFPFSTKDGLPAEEIDNIWNYNNVLYFISNNTLYKANNTRSTVRTSIPWINAKKTRFSTKKVAHLKHNQNDIEIPLDILNVLYPEKCILEYRLEGYDETWKRRPYISQIEYNKLKPGKYMFEAKAYTQDGYVSAVAIAAFQIHPPFWGTWWAYLIYIFVVVWVFRFLYMMRTKQLEQRNMALEQQIYDRTQELQEKQRKMTESIEYASLIQRSMLPPTEVINQLFFKHFVIWRPRDIVGGDFYWLHTEPGTKKAMFALIDCTGHGVPGALLSMTVNSLLNKLVKDRGITVPNQILQILHSEIGAVLYQDKAETQQDGFEIALFSIDTSARTLDFAGAGLGLIYKDNDELKILKGDKYGIGGLKRKEKLVFGLQTISYTANTVLYLYTDGILDQPDPTTLRRKRLGSKAMFEMLQRLQNGDLNTQKMALDITIKGMLEYDEQRDDITIIGIQPG